MPEQIDGEWVTLLGLEALQAPETDEGLGSEAAIACSLRRAASFGAPIARQSLIGSVLTAIADYVADHDELRTRIGDVLDRLLDHGDLLEVSKSDLGLGPRRIILLRPPAFVSSSGAYFLLGVRPDGVPILTDEEVTGDFVHHGPIRTIHPRYEGIHNVLRDAGLQEVSIEQWVSAPPEISAADLLSQYYARLMESPDSREIEGIEILDPDSDRGYYRGRFRHPSKDESGCFVSRRPQQFGPSRWCFAEFEHGTTRKVIDLPLMGVLGRPTDEAWRLQSAIDLLAGHPQLARVGDRADGQVSISFFGPLPSWAQKRLDLLGRSVEGFRGALFSYRLGVGDLATESEFLSSRLWLQIEGAP
jgi:hypothetical protein